MNYGPAEMMVIALAREINEGDTVFHGLASPVPMTAMKLAKALGVNYTYLCLADGVDPDWQKPAYSGSTLSMNQYEGAVATFGLHEIFDLACSNRVDIAFLSLVQMSQDGSINMSFVGGSYDQPKVRLPGGAGSATLTPVTKRTTIWKTKHDKNAFVSQVAYTTAKPDPSKQFKVVTNLCTMVLKNGLLELESIHPYSSLEEVKTNTGWEITQTSVPWTPEPTAAEMAALEKIDPNRIRDVEF
ncbi:MAG: CoA-transferase [Negativicutes bacterium]|nr:CoA-transferase [Negativicutes bacterium]